MFVTWETDDCWAQPWLGSPGWGSVGWWILRLRSAFLVGLNYHDVGPFQTSPNPGWKGHPAIALVFLLDLASASHSHLTSLGPIGCQSTQHLLRVLASLFSNPHRALAPCPRVVAWDTRQARHDPVSVEIIN